MKKAILFLTVILITLNSYSQVPYWAWAKSIAGSTGSTSDRGQSIATDIYGNVIMVGCFSSSTITFGTTTITNSSNTYYKDMFIAKYDSSGNVLWAKCFGGIYEEEANGVTTDINGNIFIIGKFNSPSISFGTTTLINKGSYDIFIVKFDSFGNVIWAKSEGGTYDDNSYGIATDANGNVVLLGNYSSSSIIIGTNTLTNVGNSDILLAKYSGTGSVLWAKSIGGNSTDYGYGVTIDNNGNVAVTGNFISPSITDGVTTLTNTKNGAMFLIKYNSLGNFIWSDSWSGSSINKGRCVATDNDGNTLLLGNFGDTLMTFGTITITCQYTSSALIKYDAAGNAIWAKICSGGKINGSSIATDSQGNVFLSGDFICPSINFGSSFLINSGSNDMLIVKYDFSGNEKWGKSSGGSYPDYCSNVAAYHNGNAAVLGTFFSNTITFGTNTLTNSGSSQCNIYISKLNTGSTVDIYEPKIENDFSIYPNPFNFKTTILFSEEKKNVVITLIDMFGKEVKMMNFSGKKLTIDKGDLNSGIYFMQIIDADKNLSIKKIMIQ